MDYQALLYDPNYAVHGVDAVLSFATGENFDMTALDKTSGIDVGDGVRGQTILPAAVLRVVELTGLGITVDRLSEENAKITLNGFVWNIESIRLRPSPNGEKDGEVYLLLSEKQEGKDAMGPAVYDFTWMRGSTTPFTVQLKTTDQSGVESNINFDDVRLSVFVAGVLLFRKTLIDGNFVVTDAGNAEVEWKPTAADTRSLPVGPNATYELEVRFESSQDVYLIGTITGAGGLNDD